MITGRGRMLAKGRILLRPERRSFKKIAFMKNNFAKVTKDKLEKMKSFFSQTRRLWSEIILLIICVILSSILFCNFQTLSFNTSESFSILTSILTVNGVFSAILITYLFSRITWDRDKKIEHFKKASDLSQKITYFRQILHKLTCYFNVWEHDESTIKLLDPNESFKTIDYFEYEIVSNFERPLPSNTKQVNDLMNHSDFKKGESRLYLAMISLVKDRKDSIGIKEITTNFEKKGLYKLSSIQSWKSSNIFNTIWCLLKEDQHWINYSALSNDKDFILETALKIDEKYKGYQLDDKLISELANDIDSHLLHEIDVSLKYLEKGIQGLNLLLNILISLSLFFGVLLPLVLFLNSKEEWFNLMVVVTVSINCGMISYFILKFPFLINKEIKWI